MSKSALSNPPPKENPSLILHQQKRSSQAGTSSMDGMRTVYCHTHGIITSSNARVGQAVQNHASMGLLSGLNTFSRRKPRLTRKPWKPCSDPNNPRCFDGWLTIAGGEREVKRGPKLKGLLEKVANFSSNLFVFEAKNL